MNNKPKPVKKTPAPAERVIAYLDNHLCEYLDGFVLVGVVPATDGGEHQPFIISRVCEGPIKKLVPLAINQLMGEKYSNPQPPPETGNATA